MEIKVFCDCGQKFKFDVEPVNGQMPFTVTCPVCNRDGTSKANEMLQQLSVFKAVGTAPTAAPVPMAPSPVQAPPPPPISSGAPRLRISAAAHAPEPQPAPASAEASAPPTIAPSIAPIAGRRFSPSGISAAIEPPQKGNFGMGLLGAVVGALVGAAAYFFIYKLTGPIPFLRYVLAIGVGGLAGWLANFLGKGEGSKELGGLAAVFTIVAIISAQYFLELSKFRNSFENDETTQSIADGGYTASVQLAKEVVKAIPNGSDAEIRMYIAKQQAEEGQPPKLETVSQDEIKQFRETELTIYQDLASGKLTKEAFWAKNGFDPKAASKAIAAGENAVSGLVVILAVLKAGIFSMIAGAALAYRLSANA